MRTLFQIILSLVLVATSSLAFAKDDYYCPMHTSYHSDKPGACPICGMNLVKAEGKAKSVGIVLDIPQQELIGIKTVVAKHMPLTKIIRTSGYVSTMHDVYVFQDEYIKAYKDYVNAFRDQKRFEHARRNSEAHRDVQLKLHEAEDKLLRFGFSHSEIEKLQKYSWVTPWEQSGLSFFNDDQHFWVVAQFYEQDLGYIEAGQEVRVEIPAYHETVLAKIKTVGQIIDPQTRTVNALIEISDYRGELAGNMFVNILVDVKLNDFVMVPQDAVMDTGLRKIVFVETRTGVFQERDVEVVALGDNGWAIKSGLMAGEKVVVNGNFFLDSESKMRASIDGGNDHD